MPDPMLVLTGTILVLTFTGIFTEKVHGIERAKFAMAGAGAMIIAGQVFGFYSPQAAIEAIDWNVIFLLAIMMIIVSIMTTTGGFEHIAHGIAARAGGSQFRLIFLLGAAVSVFSMLLDNVTTVIIFGPLIVLICQMTAINPIPFLIAAAMLSNTGGVATLVGDPPNMMIGSAADIGFLPFLLHMIVPVVLSWVAILLTIRYLFRRSLLPPITIPVVWQEHFTHRNLWNKSMGVLALMLILFLFHDLLAWPPWIVAATGLTLLLFLAERVSLEEVTAHIETPLLIFFIALFIVIGGVERSGLLHHAGTLMKPLILHQPLIAALVLLWVAALLSALIDNIPFTAAMIPVLTSLKHQGIDVDVLWWSLALGVGMGGNGSHIGSTANIYIVTVSEQLARKTGNPDLQITPGLWLRMGTPAMLLSLLACSLFILVAYPWIS
ncbi:MAG: hypothetical protein KDI36_13170 [Pseudomonadales bacterium]|nr:hypothetical protein [Pseudomonadales bacterium]